MAARLRQLGGNLEEASADLGAGVCTAFRLVTFPQVRTALVAGMLLSFALSFDEIVVTTFTAGAGQDTLPLWIFHNMFRPNYAPYGVGAVGQTRAYELVAKGEADERREGMAAAG